MKKYKFTQKGQVLILVALMLMGLFAMSALAIESGNILADRRQAQNSADSAALAAAMHYAQNPFLSANELASIAISRAGLNGYKGIEPRSKVQFTILPKLSTNCPDDPSGYIFQVLIDSNVPTFFGKIIGLSTLHNRVSARALGCGAYRGSMFNGNTIAVLNDTQCRSLELGGTSLTKLSSSTGQGIYVFSTCDDPSLGPQNALYGGSGTIITPSASVVGGVYGANIFLPTVVQAHVAKLKKDYPWPVITAAECGGTVTESPAGTLNPGVFPGNNNAWKTKSFPPAGITQLNPGLYCLDNDFKTTNTDSLNGSAVTIYVRSGGVSIQGGAITLDAINASPYDGLLFYIPVSNTSGYVSISGSGTSSYSGSIVAPGAHVTLNGGGDVSGPFQTQVIADTMSIGGSGQLNLFFDADIQYKPPVSAKIELLK